MLSCIAIETYIKTGETKSQRKGASMNNGTPHRAYKDRNLQIIFGVTLMSVLGLTSIHPAFPGVKEALGVTDQQVGLLITAYALPGILSAPLVGILADKWGRGKVLTPSLLLFGIAGGACALIGDFNLILLMRALQGIGGSALGILNIAIIGDLFSEERRIEAMGYNASVLNVGTGSFPLIGGALATFAWHYPFALPLMAIPIAIFVSTRLKSPEPLQSQDFREYSKKVLNALKNHELLGAYIATALTFVMVYGSYITYFSILLSNSFEVSPFWVGALTSTMMWVSAFVSSQLGRITKYLPNKNLIKVAFILYAIALAIIPFIRLLPLLLLPTAIFGIAHGINIPSIHTLLAEHSSLEYRGMTMSLNSIFIKGGQSLGPLLMGLAFSLGGLNSTFFLGAFISIVAFISALYFLR